MDERLTGCLVLRSAGSVSDLGLALAGAVERSTFFGIRRYSVGTHPRGRLRRWDREAFARAVLSNPRAVTLALAAESALGSQEDAALVSFAKAQDRCTDCGLVELEFGEHLVRHNNAAVLEFTDGLAREFAIQSGHLHDLEDFAEQNQRGVHYFKLAGKDVDPAKLVYSEAVGTQVVDVELNPCHLHVVGAVDFTSAWTNYLGPEFLRQVPQEVVNELSGTVIRLRSDLIRVTLFDDPFCSRDPKNVARLWDFRRRLRLDEIAHRGRQ